MGRKSAAHVPRTHISRQCGNCVFMSPSCLLGGVNATRRGMAPPRAVVPAVSIASTPPIVSTAGNSLAVVHSYVFIMHSGPGQVCGGQLRPRAVVPTVSTADHPPAAVSAAGNSVIAIHRCICVGQSPKPNMGSCARCLHTRPAPPPLSPKRGSH